MESQCSAFLLSVQSCQVRGQRQTAIHCPLESCRMKIMCACTCEGPPGGQKRDLHLTCRIDTATIDNKPLKLYYLCCNATVEPWSLPHTSHFYAYFIITNRARQVKLLTTLCQLAPMKVSKPYFSMRLHGMHV